MLELKNVTKKFGEVTAIDDVSFKVKNGKIFGLIGRNGAGKSTTFRVILQIIEQTSGEILYDNEKIDKGTLNKFGYLPEEGSLIPSYTVLELCEYYGALKLMDKETIRKELIEWLKKFDILEYLNKKIKDLSKGNKQKIQFIVSNLHHPDFLILDEPFSGLDPISVEEIKKSIIELKEQGKTIIFSSHRMDHVEDLCDDIAILEKGKIIISGNLNDIKKKCDNKNLNQIFIDIVGESKNEF